MDAEFPPDRTKWADPMYFEEAPDPVKSPSSGGNTKGQKWVEQLDSVTGQSVRLYESASQASNASGVPTHLIQQALATGIAQDAGGFKWRYADEDKVMQSKQLWEHRSHLTKVSPPCWRGRVA
jgi:hypothetical protein